jgi:hypothetical protein
MSRLMPAPSDGRAFTSYLSAGQTEDLLMRRLGIRNQTQYRAFLQTNPHTVLREMHRAGGSKQPGSILLTSRGSATR